MAEEEIIVNQVPGEQPPVADNEQVVESEVEEPEDKKKSKPGILDEFCDYLDGDEL